MPPLIAISGWLYVPLVLTRCTLVEVDQSSIYKTSSLYLDRWMWRGCWMRRVKNKTPITSPGSLSQCNATNLLWWFVKIMFIKAIRTNPIKTDSRSCLLMHSISRSIWSCLRYCWSRDSFSLNQSILYFLKMFSLFLFPCLYNYWSRA